MEYKTKGKEGTNAKGQKKESKLGKVNKKRGNESKCPGKEKRDKADDISNNFPNFNVLTQEEKLAFFEALSTARKNIEKRGLPTRERFGTVHDEYLQYFAKDVQAGTVQNKPGTAPSVRPSWSPVASHRSPKESKDSATESPKQKVPRNPKSVSPTPKKASKPPQKDPLRPESEPIDYCEKVIKRDTEKMIQIYLNKKKRIEEQWKKSSEIKKSAPVKTTVHKSPKPRNKEAARPESVRAVSGAAASRAKTPSEAADTPQFQALTSTERKEFFRILKEAHTNVLDRNPQKKNEILTLDEVLKPYRSGGCSKLMSVCRAEAKNFHNERELPKNLRVKVTLTSGDNERLCRTKSQILNDSAKEESGERSKSLENMLSADTVHGKQSKIPILRKAPQEKDECNDDNHGTTTVMMKKTDRDLNETAPAAAESREGVTGEAKKVEAEGKEMKNMEKEKRRVVTITKGRKADQGAKECDDNHRDENFKNFSLLKLKVLNLDKRKAEFKKVEKEKERSLVEGSKKDKELSKKKRKEDLKRRHQKEETLIRKDANKSNECSCDCSELLMVGKKITEEECAEVEEKEHSQKKMEFDGMQSQKRDSNCRRTEEGEDEATKQESEEEEDEATKQESEEEEDEATKQESEEECLGQQASVESRAEAANECEEKLEAEPDLEETESSTSSSCEDDTDPEHQRTFSSKVGSEQVVRAATQSKRSLAAVSLVEEKPKEVWQAQEWAPTLTTGKVIVVDDNVIKRIKDLIQYLENKVNPKDDLESEYVRLVLSYTEYLTKVTESLVRRNAKQGQQVHSTYAAHEVHLKFENNDDKASKEEAKKDRIPRSISENEFYRQIMPAPSGIEKTEEHRRKPSTADFPMLSDSESSSNSEGEYRTLPPSFKKAGIPMTKIRLLQDLLKGRARFVRGSIDDFKIVHYPEAEYVPPEKTPTEQTKELSESDVDHVEKVIRKKFLRNLAKLCNCGRKQVEEDAILENLKGEAVRVDAIEGKKDPASATINDDTMEVLKAAERKKIIQKYLGNEKS